MIFNSRLYNIKKVRTILIFFYGFILIFYGCEQEGSPGPVEVIYKNEKAVGIQMEYSGNPDPLGIYREGDTETAVLGRFDKKNGQLAFSPPVPFTPGQGYEIRAEGRKLAEFSIPSTKPAKPPEIVGIYPAQDSVPENLLKIYLQFSQPMQQVGNALDYITVYNSTENKKESIFLPLETELWNREHDRLTLWLDPGRIKTDLIPNREQGLPFTQGNTYILTVDKKWKTSAGQELKKTYHKKLFITASDSQKPNLKNWKVDEPAAKSTQALSILFDEPLDHILAKESMSIHNPNGKTISGEWKLNKRGTKLDFIPSSSWEKGIYELQVNSKLEDLVGNNLERLFDENLGTFSKAISEQNGYRIQFTIDPK